MILGWHLGRGGRVRCAGRDGCRRARERREDGGELNQRLVMAVGEGRETGLRGRILQGMQDIVHASENKVVGGCCTTLYGASISNSIQYTLLLVSNTTLVHWPCTVLGYAGRLVIQ